MLHFYYKLILIQFKPFTTIHMNYSHILKGIAIFVSAKTDNLLNMSLQCNDVDRNDFKNKYR